MAGGAGAQRIDSMTSVRRATSSKFVRPRPQVETQPAIRVGGRRVEGLLSNRFSTSVEQRSPRIFSRAGAKTAVFSVDLAA